MQPALLGERIEQILEVKPWSLQDLAAKSGKSEDALNRYLDKTQLAKGGRRWARKDMVAAIAMAIRMTEEDFRDTELFRHWWLAEQVNQRSAALGISLDKAEREAARAIDPEIDRDILGGMKQMESLYRQRMEPLPYAILRSYQERHRLYFPELEEAANEVRPDAIDLSRGPEERLASLSAYLKSRGVHFLQKGPWSETPRHAAVDRLKWVRRRKNEFYLNPALSPEQRVFILATVVGRLRLGYPFDSGPISSHHAYEKTRGYTDYLQAFQTQYFAAALLLPEADFKEKVSRFFGRSSWDEQAFLDLAAGVRPEPFFYRLISILPQLGVSYYSFSKIEDRYEPLSDADSWPRFRPVEGHVYAPGEMEKEISRDMRPQVRKVLNLSGFLDIRYISAAEHRCRRWGAMRQLIRLRKLQYEGREPARGAVAGAQRSITLGWQYPDPARAPEFLVLTAAYPLNVDWGANAAVSLAILLDPSHADRKASGPTVGAGPAVDGAPTTGGPESEVIRFGKWAGGLDTVPDSPIDGAIATTISCERCALTCGDRLAGPEILARYEERKAQAEAHRAWAEGRGTGADGSSRL